MTNVIRTLVSPEGTIRIDVIEGDTSADVVNKLEAALEAHPQTPKLGRTSIKDMMYGRKTTVSGWHVEVNGVSLAPSAQAAIAPAVAAPTAAPAPAVAAAPTATPAAPTPAAPAPVASPAAAGVKHATSRKPRTARKVGAAPVVIKGRQEKIYKVGPTAAVGTGMMARIQEAVSKGYNTQAKMFAFFGPDAKKATIQHELCCAGHPSRKWVIVDEDAMKKAAAAPATAAPAPAASPAPAPAAAPADTAAASV